jgi:hypothetical protein
MMALIGYDLLVIDLERGPVALSEAADMMRGIARTDAYQRPPSRVVITQSPVLKAASSRKRLIEAFRELKVQRISHCETLQVSVAFAVVEQAFEL